MAICAGMTACATTGKHDRHKSGGAKPVQQAAGKEYFSEKAYGVKASPRVVEHRSPVPKGGGRYMVGKPYQVKGKTYVPREEPGYNKSGLASWYGAAFHGRLTANGEVYDSRHLSAAHPTFPLPSYARVTNVDNGSSVVVRVNDRGPFHAGRIVDVSEKAAELLEMKTSGTARVNVQYVGPARMDGHDMPFLMASYSRKGDRLPQIRPEGQIATGVMVASAAPAAGSMQDFGGGSGIQPMAMAGRSPTAGYPVADPSAAPAGSALEALAAFAALPDYGPLPVERPGQAGMVAAPAAISAAQGSDLARYAGFTGAY